RREQTLTGHGDVVDAPLVVLGEERVASGSNDNTIKLRTLPPSLGLMKTATVSAPVNAGAPTSLLSSHSVEHKDHQPAVPAVSKADEKALVTSSPVVPKVGHVPQIAWKELQAGDYSQAAASKVFGSKALHHNSPTSGNVDQNAVSASASAKTPKPMPMGY